MAWLKIITLDEAYLWWKDREKLISPFNPAYEQIKKYSFGKFVIMIKEKGYRVA
jgi:hypothetical protein